MSGSSGERPTRTTLEEREKKRKQRAKKAGTLTHNPNVTPVSSGKIVINYQVNIFTNLLKNCLTQSSGVVRVDHRNCKYKYNTK